MTPCSAGPAARSRARGRSGSERVLPDTDASADASADAAGAAAGAGGGTAAAAGGVSGRARAAAQVTPIEDARNPCMPLIVDMVV
ncbi:hypothetical protein Sdagh_55480 [Streptomyces daghestanicus]|uniref:Uncharacterized protein n=1 Tax=Streptomyces daghestanicus TaxID=66885 RepID=A0ABQ3Q973_9ACTN|nr:hypothetical protein Sdagh_55480 [Streptomyces daghestanicus]